VLNWLFDALAAWLESRRAQTPHRRIEPTLDWPGSGTPKAARAASWSVRGSTNR